MPTCIFLKDLKKDRIKKHLLVRIKKKGAVGMSSIKLLTMGFADRREGRMLRLSILSFPRPPSPCILRIGTHPPVNDG